MILLELNWFACCWFLSFRFPLFFLIFYLARIHLRLFLRMPPIHEINMCLYNLNAYEGANRMFSYSIYLFNIYLFKQMLHRFSFFFLPWNGIFWRVILFKWMINWSCSSSIHKMRWNLCVQVRLIVATLSMDSKKWKLLK